MYLCELVNSQNGMEISGVKTDPAETQRTNETLKFVYILIFKSVKTVLLFHFNIRISERPGNICFAFIFTGNIWWRELQMFQGVQKSKPIWNMTFNEPHLLKQTKKQTRWLKSLATARYFFILCFLLLSLNIPSVFWLSSIPIFSHSTKITLGSANSLLHCG